MGRKRIGQPRGVRYTVAGKFGQRLEQLATAAGLSTAEFAKKAGVTEDAIRKYFRGTDVPRVDRWPRIAATLRLETNRRIALIMESSSRSVHPRLDLTWPNKPSHRGSCGRANSASPCSTSTAERNSDACIREIAKLSS